MNTETTTSTTTTTTISPNTPIILSKYAQALIEKFQEGAPKPPPPNTPKISVSQTVSFAAFIYEKMRNAIEYREDHLIRRASIERILKRRMVLNKNGSDIGEPLIKEMLWARYLENNTIPENKSVEIQSIIDKYFYLRNEFIVGRPTSEQKKFSDWIIDVTACEIEERLCPDLRREAFTNYVYHMMRPKVQLADNAKRRDVQMYIAVERAFAKSDDPLIRYHILKLIAPELTFGTWKDAERILPNFKDMHHKIEDDLAYSRADVLRRFVKKQSPPFLIIRDIFELYPKQATEILQSEEKLTYRVDEICRKRYEETQTKLRRAGVRSFLYIVLTKVVFALALEVPYDSYVAHSIAYIPIMINVLFPPIFMAAIILSVHVPGHDNTKRIQTRIKQILIEDPDSPDAGTDHLLVGKVAKVRSPMLNFGFSIIYLLAFVASFGFIITVLSRLHFNIVSQSVFIVFLTLVTFFAYRIRHIAREYLIEEKDGVLGPVIDLFMLPLLRVGQWLSGEISKINLFIFIFDFVIEAPFKAIFEVVEEWIRFVKIKKDEMV